MPILDLPRQELNTPLDTPQGFVVTPGKADVDLGSDALIRGAETWAAGRQEAPTMQRVFDAAFDQDNVLRNVIRHALADPLPQDNDPAFKGWDSIKGTPYEARWSSFTDIPQNREAYDARKRKIDDEEEGRRILDAAPWWQSFPAQMVAGTIDLPTLLPGGTFVRGVKGGFSVARSGLSVGAAAGVSSLAQETALHALEETRTVGESAVNVGASVILGGLLGAGGAKLLTGAEWKAAVAAVEADVEGLSRSAMGAELMPIESAVPASAGAAAARPTDLEGNTIAGSMAGAVAGSTKILNPVLRALHSPAAEWRDIATQLFENSVYLKKNFDDVASHRSAETLMKPWNAGLAEAVEATAKPGAVSSALGLGKETLFSQYVKAGGQLKHTEFQEAVGKAMRRADQHPDPFIAKGAQIWRAKVFDPLKEAAIETGQLPANVTVEEAASYFSRMWARNKLIADEGRFKAIVTHYVATNMPRWAEKFDKGTEARLNPLRREIDDLEIGKLRRAEEVKLRGEELETGEFRESDIRSALRIVEGGAPKPKGVETLTQFVHKAGGLIDFSGELAHMGINNRSRPGFVRKQRMRSQSDGGGWAIDDMARHAWENGYFPEHLERPSPRDFLDALSDDFNKHRAVVRAQDRDAYRLNELIDQLEADLSRVGARTGQANRFATSEEVKGIVSRVYQALDAEADRKIAALKTQLLERETSARIDRESRFMDEPDEAGRKIADEVFNAMTGKTVEDGVRPEFITVTTRGPLKERTFHIPDTYSVPGLGSIEDFLEHNVEMVGRRYTRIMGADVELARKFGSPDMEEQIFRVRENYKQLRAETTTQKRRKELDKSEESDIDDLKGVRDLLRGSSRFFHPVEKKFDTMSRGFNHFNYIRSMGEVVMVSINDAVRPAMVHGLSDYMSTVGQLATNLPGIKMSVAEAKLAGNISEVALGNRMATISEIIDPMSPRGPTEAFLANMTNVASKWNGIRIWTDWMQSVASVMTQNRILRNVKDYAKIDVGERAYLNFLTIDQSMAERIAAQYAKHGKLVGGVRVANTEEWTRGLVGADLDFARADVRAYRAAMNIDVDSIIVKRSVADVPLFAHTPTGRMLLQFKSFALASHQKVLLRGLQEDQSRFVGGVIAMTMMGMLITYLKAVSGNRPETQKKTLTNPGWWIGEGLDRSGIFSVPLELSNAFEKFSGFNPIKAPFKAFDPQDTVSQKNQFRNRWGALAGPTAGMLDDAFTVGSIPNKVREGKEVSRGDIRSGLNLLPFNSFLGVRQMLNYVVNPPEP